MKLLVGFITYNESTAKYLPYFLPSLDRQTFKDFEIFAIDNSDQADNENSRFLKNNYSSIKFKWAHGNIGFARANNIIINRAIERGAEYIMLLNPDTIIEPDAVDKMVLALDKDIKLGSVSAKLLKWDFEKQLKTDIVDSCGMVMKRGLRFFDQGQNQRDIGLFDNSEILGPSGTAPMYRISALQKIKFTNANISPLLSRKRPGEGENTNQYFDELMFMYKEDCDINYRLKLAGYNSRLASSAKIYHDRSAAGIGESDIKAALVRRSKSRQVKKWSFLYQHIMFVKFWKTLNITNKIAALYYALKMFIFVLVFEQYLFKEYINLFKIRKKIVKYRK